MTTQKEREIIDEKAKKIIELAAGGDANAAQYLWMLARITRVLDDVFDNDQVITREEHLEVLEYLFVRLPTNPFFIRHQDVLLSQHLSMFNAWMAANEAEKGDDTDQIYAHVWRDTLHEVIPIVALLTQGYDAMPPISQEVRKLFKKQLGE
jgi:integrase